MVRLQIILIVWLNLAMFQLFLFISLSGCWAKIFDSPNYLNANCLNLRYAFEEVISMAVLEDSMLIYFSDGYLVIFDDLKERFNQKKSILLNHGRYYANLNALFPNSQNLQNINNFTKNLNVIKSSYFCTMSFGEHVTRNYSLHFFLISQNFRLIEPNNDVYRLLIDGFTFYPKIDLFMLNIYHINVPFVFNHFIRTIHLETKAFLVVFFYKDEYAYIKLYRDNSGLGLDLIGYLCTNISSTTIIRSDTICGIENTHQLSGVFTAAFTYNNKIHLIYAETMVMIIVDKSLFKSTQSISYETIKLDNFFTCGHFPNSSNDFIMGQNRINLRPNIYQQKRIFNWFIIGFIIMLVKNFTLSCYVSIACGQVFYPDSKPGQ